MKNNSAIANLLASFDMKDAKDCAIKFVINQGEGCFCNFDLSDYICKNFHPELANYKSWSKRQWKDYLGSRAKDCFMGKQLDIIAIQISFRVRDKGRKYTIEATHPDEFLGFDRIITYEEGLGCQPKHAFLTDEEKETCKNVHGAVKIAYGLREKRCEYLLSDCAMIEKQAQLGRIYRYSMSKGEWRDEPRLPNTLA